MGRVSKWLRCKLTRAAWRDKTVSDCNVISPANPTALLPPPVRGHRILTPSTSQEQLLILSSSSSPFFARLPSEIREKIYLEAFGNKIIHMDLEHDRVEPSFSSNAIHAHSPIRGSGMVHQGWYWWSCVCHRLPRQEFFYDHCRSGGGACMLYPGKWPEHCFLGVLGWLLTCRRAYLETIDLLYGSNTIHISATILHYQLPKLLLSQRLKSITSLELVWNPTSLDPVATSFHRIDPYPVRQEFQNAFNNLHINYPRLTKLHLSLQFSSPANLNAKESSEPFENLILRTLDSMVRNYAGQLKDCVVAISETLEGRLVNKNLMRHVDKERMDMGGIPWWRLWRTVDPIDESPETLGYWIRKGVEDGLKFVSCF